MTSHWTPFATSNFVWITIVTITSMLTSISTSAPNSLLHFGLLDICHFFGIRRCLVINFVLRARNKQRRVGGPLLQLPYCIGFGRHDAALLVLPHSMTPLQNSQVDTGAS